MKGCKQPWPVLFLCCVLSFNSTGMAFGMGAIFTDLMDIFLVSRATASLVQSLCIGLIFLTGVLTGHFQQRHGPGVTVITGSVLATAGCIIAFLATHIVQVIVGIGVIAGCGTSFIFLTTQMVLGTMFYDSKSLALTVNSLATAAGSSLYPLFYRYLVDEYSVRGTFLIMAAVNCQLILCGAFIGFFASRTRSKTAETKEPEKEIEMTGEVNVAVNIIADEESDGNSRNSGARHDADVSVHATGKEESRGNSRKSGDEDAAAVAVHVVGKEESGGNTRKTDDNDEAAISVDVAGENSAHLVKRSCMCCACDSSCCPASKKSTCLQTEILRNKTFVLFVLSGGTASMFLRPPLIFITDIVTANQLTVEDGSFFLSMMAVGSACGRLMAGVLYKLLQSRALYVFSVSIAVTGVICLFFAFARQYSHFLVASVFHGTALGVQIANMPIVYLEILGPGRFSVGRGYAGTMEGVFFFLTGPYGGLVRDLTNSYEALFYVAIVYGLLAGSLLFFTSIHFHRHR